MAAELKDLIELTGYTMPSKAEDFNISDFKRYFTSKFISLDAIEDNEDVVKKITGKRMGIIETKLSQSFGLKPSYIRNLKLEQIIEKVADTTTKTIDKLKKEASSGTNDKIEELILQLEEKEKSITDYKTLAEETKTEYNKFKLVADTNLKNYKITDKLNKAFSAVPFVDGFDEDNVRKASFNTVIKSKYQFDLDDNDELVVKDEKGHRIKNQTDATKFALPADILTLEAKANKLLKKNNAKVLFNTRSKTGSENGNIISEQNRKFQINARAQARLEGKV